MLVPERLAVLCFAFKCRVLVGQNTKSVSKLHPPPSFLSITLTRAGEQFLRAHACDGPEKVYILYYLFGSARLANGLSP